MTKDSVIILLVMLTLVWRAFAFWFSEAVATEEKANDRLLERVWELQRVDKQKCIDLFLNDKI